MRASLELNEEAFKGRPAFWSVGETCFLNSTQKHIKEFTQEVTQEFIVNGSSQNSVNSAGG